MAKGKTQQLWQRAVGITMFMLLIGFGGVIFNLVRWQIVHGEELHGEALDQSLRDTTLTAKRGTIYDVTGEKILAQSASVWTVVLEPKYIIKDETREKIIIGLAEILDMDEEEIRKKSLDKSSAYTYLKRQIETDVKDEIVAYMNANDIEQGILLINDYKRYYPYGSVASTVLGYTGYEQNGLSGVEYEYDEELRGSAGRLTSAKNAIGTDMPFQYEENYPAEDGYDLVLTIDETVQSIMEKHLQDGIDQFVVQNGAVAIMMNVDTGAIIGLASKGDFDPNDPFTIYNEEKRAEIDALPEAEQEEARMNEFYRQTRNKAVSDNYYPGSVFKMCTGAIGLEEGIITPESTFTCGGEAIVGSEHISCWNKSGHGLQTFTQGMCNSCNPFFINIGKEIGSETFFRYFDAFGFTEYTGIDLPGEASCNYFEADEMTPIDLAVVSMGQNFAITPVHMITAACAVANGGYLVQPHVVDRMIDNEGNIINTIDKKYKRQVISEKTSQQLTEILFQNTHEGTAKSGYIEGYSICGKTGTSEKMDEFLKHPERGKQYLSSYCGYASKDNPRYALLVVFDEPDYNKNGGQTSGNAVAGPIFNSIMREVLPYLDVKSNYSDEEFDSMAIFAPDVTGITLGEAYDLLDEEGLSYEVIGKEEDHRYSVTAQIPAAGTQMPKDGMIVLYTSGNEEDGVVTIPEFQGMTLAQAIEEGANAGVQVMVMGQVDEDTSTAVLQDIAAGTETKRGTVVAVTFTDNIITDTFMNAE